MLKLATLLDNPGEPKAASRYRDPRVLRELGYNGLVLYETTGLSGIRGPDDVSPGEMRHWVEQQFAQTRQTIERATQAGLDVFVTYDALSLPRHVVSQNVDAFTCRRRPETICPASDAAIERSAAALDAMLIQFPEVRGVVLRFGDSDAGRLPWLIGNDLYLPHCPRCSRLGRADRIANLLAQFHALVVGRHGRTLIARAWNLRPGGMHDSVEICGQLRDRLPGEAGDGRFILAFKFTHTDFWRYQLWNPPSLTFGDRPILYELQCQREFEGKGSIPNWQVPLWRDGHPEVEGDAVHGLAEVARKVNVAGLLAWVRGGGWGGPFVKDETWIDANVRSVPRLADQPTVSAEVLANQWIAADLGLVDDEAAAMRQVLDHSTRNALEAFYFGAYARGLAKPWHPSGEVIQDDLIDAQAAWRVMQRLPEGALEDVVREKQAAAERIGEDRIRLQRAVTPENRRLLEPLVNTLVYGESLFASLRDLTEGLTAYRRYQKSRRREDAEQAAQRLLAAQGDWNHHTQRHGSLPGAATAFREVHFWELSQQIIADAQG